MGFKSAVENTPGLEQAYRSGLRAISRRDLSHMSCRDPRTITGSVNLDIALARLLPNEPLWDYGVGIKPQRRPEKVVWIEVHPASSDHVKEVIRKFDWLKAWLRTQAQEFNTIQQREFVWIASGSVRLQGHSQQRRMAAQQGLRFVGGHMQLS